MTPRCCPVCCSDDVQALGPNDFQCSVCQAKIAYSTAQVSISPPPAAAASGICPFCHTQNEQDATYCFHCSTKLRRECPSCQEVIRTDARFCPRCRVPLERPALLQFVSDELAGTSWKEFATADEAVTRIGNLAVIPPKTAWLFAKARANVRVGDTARDHIIIGTASEVSFIEIEPRLLRRRLITTFRYADLDEVYLYSEDILGIRDKSGGCRFDAGSEKVRKALCLLFRYFKEKP